MRLEGVLWGKPERVCLWSSPILLGYPTGDLQLKKEALRPPGGQPLVPRTASHLQGLTHPAVGIKSGSCVPATTQAPLHAGLQATVATVHPEGVGCPGPATLPLHLPSPLSLPSFIFPLFSPTHSSRSQFWPSALSGTLEDPTFCSRKANQGREQGNVKEGNSNASHRTQIAPLDLTFLLPPPPVQP